VTRYSQEFWINKDTNKAIIPIMRNASTSIKNVLSQHKQWQESHTFVDVNNKFYTVWRDPYWRFLSALGRELSDILDNHKGNERSILENYIIEWSENPDSMLQLKHMLSQTDTCKGATEPGSDIIVYRFDCLQKMMQEATQLDVHMPLLNESAKHHYIILEFLDKYHTKWMEGWHQDRYKQDYLTWSQLTNSETCVISN
jgi:hypothetical protein